MKTHLYADTIIKGGKIITMTGEDDTASWVAVQDGIIIDVGISSGYDRYIGPDTVVRDLEGQVMLPGFYDGHSHFSTGGLTALYYEDLRSKPIGTMTCIADYIKALKNRASITPEHKPVLGTGYDQTTISEMRHPTRHELDMVSTGRPVILNHVTAHIMAVNSKALEIMGINADTPDPEGGVIRRDKDGIPNGILEESAVFYVWNNKEFNIFGTFDEQMEAFAYNSHIYASHGVTTANEGSIANLQQYEEAVRRGKMKIRSVLWFAPKDLLSDTPPIPSDDVKNMISVGGGKIFADGSVNTYTAWLTRPYHVKEPGMDEQFAGYPAISYDGLNDAVSQVTDRGYNMYIHCNGDAAIDECIKAYKKVRQKHPDDSLKLVLVHAQCARKDQLLEMQKYSITPSFYCSNVYYAGDRFRYIFLGPERAENCNPIGSAMDLGLLCTMHLDTPVQPQDPIMSIWAAVNRKTASGKTLGKDQCISVYQALLANTFYPAIQNSEGHIKGTIQKGKYADFVILDRDPLSTDPDDLINIQVMETLVGGQTVYMKGEKNEQ